MKQLIVLISTVILGITISGTVMSMGTTTTALATKITNGVESNMKIPTTLTFGQ